MPPPKTIPREDEDTPPNGTNGNGPHDHPTPPKGMRDLSARHLLEDGARGIELTRQRVDELIRSDRQRTIWQDAVTKRLTEIERRQEDHSGALQLANAGIGELLAWKRSIDAYVARDTAQDEVEMKRASQREDLITEAARAHLAVETEKRRSELAKQAAEAEMQKKLADMRLEVEKKVKDDLLAARQERRANLWAGAKKVGMVGLPILTALATTLGLLIEKC